MLSMKMEEKPIIPSEEEMEWNPRSKSAKLRVFERKEADQDGTDTGSTD